MQDCDTLDPLTPDRLIAHARLPVMDEEDAERERMLTVLHRINCWFGAHSSRPEQVMLRSYVWLWFNCRDMLGVSTQSELAALAGVPRSRLNKCVGLYRREFPGSVVAGMRSEEVRARLSVINRRRASGCIHQAKGKESFVNH